VCKGCYSLPYCLLSRVWAGKATTIASLQVAVTTAVINLMNTGLEPPCQSSEKPLTTPLLPLVL
jgi:hypothetical protein